MWPSFLLVVHQPIGGRGLWFDETVQRSTAAPDEGLGVGFAQ